MGGKDKSSRAFLSFSFIMRRDIGKKGAYGLDGQSINCG